MPLKKTKKIQIRRCSVCNKTGHNKTTCTTKIKEVEKITKTPTPIKTKQQINKKPDPQPVKFFIHHVGNDPLMSPHLVNLKKEDNTTWKKVKSYSSKDKKTSLFHYYHKLEENQKENHNKKDLMVNLNKLQNNLPAKTILREETPKD